MSIRILNNKERNMVTNIYSMQFLSKSIDAGKALIYNREEDIYSPSDVFLDNIGQFIIDFENDINLILEQEVYFRAVELITIKTKSSELIYDLELIKMSLNLVKYIVDIYIDARLNAEDVEVTELIVDRGYTPFVTPIVFVLCNLYLNTLDNSSIEEFRNMYLKNVIEEDVYGLDLLSLSNDN